MRQNCRWARHTSAGRCRANAAHSSGREQGELLERDWKETRRIRLRHHHNSALSSSGRGLRHSRHSDGSEIPAHRTPLSLCGDAAGIAPYQETSSLPPSVFGEEGAAPSFLSMSRLFRLADSSSMSPPSTDGMSCSLRSSLTVATPV